MLPILIYSLLATGSHGASIRKRQQEVSITPPKVIIQGAGPVQGTPAQGIPGVGPSPGLGTFYSRPDSQTMGSSPGAAQNLVIPNPGTGGGDMTQGQPPAAAQAGTMNPAQDPNLTTNAGPPTDGSGSPPSLDTQMGSPVDPSAPTSGNANPIPGDNSQPTGPAQPVDNLYVTPAVEASTNVLAGDFTEEQRHDILGNTTPEEFVTSSPDQQALLLAVAKAELVSTDQDATNEGIGISDEAAQLPPPDSPPDKQTYQEMQDLGVNVTTSAGELASVMQKLLDLGQEELRHNDTLDAMGPITMGTDVNGNPVSPVRKRWITTLISVLSLIVEGSKLAGEVFDEGLALYKKFKGVSTAA